MKTATDFTLTDQNGNPFNLYDNLDKPVMLVFYPKDQSLVCTKQLCSYNDNLERFSEIGIKVIAINIEDVNSHKQYSEKYEFKFPLLSDADKKVSKAYDALNFAGLNRRKIVIISPSKEIVYSNSSFPTFYQKSSELLKIIKTNKYLKMT